MELKTDLCTQAIAAEYTVPKKR